MGLLAIINNHRNGKEDDVSELVNRLDKLIQDYPIKSEIIKTIKEGRYTQLEDVLYDMVIRVREEKKIDRKEVYNTAFKIVLPEYVFEELENGVSEEVKNKIQDLKQTITDCIKGAVDKKSIIGCLESAKFHIFLMLGINDCGIYSRFENRINYAENLVNKINY